MTKQELHELIEKGENFSSQRWNLSDRNNWELVTVSFWVSKWEPPPEEELKFVPAEER